MEVLTQPIVLFLSFLSYVEIIQGEVLPSTVDLLESVDNIEEAIFFVGILLVNIGE